MRIYAPEDPAAPKKIWSRRVRAIIGIFLGMVAWLAVTVAALWILAIDVFDEAGILAISPTTKAIIALGASTGGLSLGKRILRYIDEDIAGRTRITYIRETNAESATPLEAITNADKTVDQLMTTINNKRNGSTIESRTNTIILTKRSTYRVITYITVLVSGMEISEDDLPRDLSSKQCIFQSKVFQRSCIVHTFNQSGYCDNHD